MKECKDCEFSGYSKQLCVLHTKSCSKHPEREGKALPPSVKIGATTLAGIGVGIVSVAIGLTAVSLVGGIAMVHGALIKLGAGAGLAGGGVGFLKGVSQTKGEREQGKECNNSLEIDQKLRQA